MITCQPAYISACPIRDPDGYRGDGTVARGVRFVEHLKPHNITSTPHRRGRPDDHFVVPGTGQRRGAGQRADRVGGRQRGSGDQQNSKTASHSRFHRVDQDHRNRPGRADRRHRRAVASPCGLRKGARAANPITAASVRVSTAADGKCPQANESGKRSAVKGSVASVAGNTINVTGTDANGNTTQTAVTVNEKTQYSKQAAADTQAISAGKCLTAKGTQDGWRRAASHDDRSATRPRRQMRR